MSSIECTIHFSQKTPHSGRKPQNIAKKWVPNLKNSAKPVGIRSQVRPNGDIIESDRTRRALSNEHLLCSIWVTYGGENRQIVIILLVNLLTPIGIRPQVRPKGDIVESDRTRRALSNEHLLCSIWVTYRGENRQIVISY